LQGPLARHAEAARLEHIVKGAAAARRELAQAALQASTSHRRDPSRVRPVEAARLEHIVKGAAAARREAAQAASQANIKQRRDQRGAQPVEVVRLAKFAVVVRTAPQAAVSRFRVSQATILQNRIPQMYHVQGSAQVVLNRPARYPAQFRMGHQTTLIMPFVSG
jgi:hypothetical protein